MTAATGAGRAEQMTPRVRALCWLLLLLLLASGAWLAFEVRREARYPVAGAVSSSAPTSGPLLAGFYEERRGAFAECTNKLGIRSGGIFVRSNGATLSGAGMRVDRDGERIRCEGVEGTIVWTRTGAGPTWLPTLVAVALVAVASGLVLALALRRRGQSRAVLTAAQARERDRRRAGLDGPLREGLPR
jgi:hypothetical protein